MSLNAAVAVWRTSTTRTRQRERRCGRIDRDCLNLGRGDTMTMTEICLLAWAILGAIVVAILLGVTDRRDDRGRDNRN